MGYPLLIPNDFDLFDNTELVTVVLTDSIGGTLATYAGCNALGRPERHSLADIEGGVVSVIDRRWHLQAMGAFLVAGVSTVNPLIGVTIIQGMLITTGLNSITPNETYIVQSANLVSWGTRWECETQRIIT